MNKTAYALIGLLGVLAVILTATAISAVKHSQELNAQLEHAQTELQNVQSKPTGKTTTGSNEMLQKLLAEETAVNAELRKEIERLQNQATTLVTNLPAVVITTNTVTTTRFSRGSAWLERLRKDDPERYQQVVADRDQRRKEIDDWYASTQSQLAAQAQAAATPDEADLANQIAASLANLKDLRQQVQAANELPPDQQSAQLAQLMPQLQAAVQDMSQLRDQARTVQYQQLATQLGLSTANAQTLVTTIPQILQSTTFTPPRGNGGLGFGGGSAATPPATSPTTPTTPTK